MAELAGRDRRAAEVVVLHHVCAGLEIAAMDLAHDVGAREVQHLGAVLLVPVVIFDGEVHRLHAAAHGAVAEQNLLGQLVQQTTHERPPASNRRSEEHTSELQSLMRISYAVFCLKKITTPSDT